MVVFTANVGETIELFNAVSLVSDILSLGSKKPFMFYYDEYEPFSKICPIPELLSKKMESLGNLLSGEEFGVFIIPIRALVLKTIPIDILRQNIISFKKGSVMYPSEVIGSLIKAGYERDNIVDMRGKFSFRGEVLDVFAINQKFPVRVIFFGSTIEKLKLFDIESQRGFKEIDFYNVIPVNEFIIDEELKRNTIENIKEVASENGLPARIIKNYIDELDASFVFNLKAHYVPFMYNFNCSSLLDYIPILKEKRDDVVIFSSDKRGFISDMDEYYEGIMSNYNELLNSERIVPPFDALVVKKEILKSLIESSLEVSSGYYVPNIESLMTQLRLYLRKNTDVSLEEIKNGFESLISTFEKVVFLYTSEEQRRVFVEILSLMGKQFSEDGILKNTNIILRHGDISSVFSAKNILFFPLNLIIRGTRKYEYEETLHDKIRMLRLKFSEIKIGDYVVHKDFGIGIYRGLKKMVTDGGMQDYIVIEYKDKRLLYLPALNIDLISKYESGEGKSPAISPLGKEQWQRKKLRIKEELLKFASEILRIKAERRLVRKEPIAFHEELYEKFCEGFEFAETLDQLKCIEEVKNDLLCEYPMERIVCGDVGFGKTEIILRAAFIVASAGYQVAILVPTTILAEQHFNNFLHRLKDFPIRVEMLSRFVPREKSLSIVRDIGEGKVDIVIGTHKILSSGIQFKRLRLLVIDEEHRFGVEQKERLKKDNPDVDVLITTATPIPRTLHMGLANLVDLSVMITPPEGRVPVRTIISKFDEGIIRNAILKELKRGGQIFFVNPRIRTIETMARRLEGLLPGIRVAVAHGRMPTERIEEVMYNFYHGKFDLLVSTNIIGSGLDLPNVNTIIVESAELFGLSELYQLRGRVGRRRVNAYAYFLFSSIASLKRDVKKKMDILYRHQALGAGFNIASEDLEIRGAGEILGKRQAGFIDGIGFDLYNELLEDAIMELKGSPKVRLYKPEIRVDVPVFIPDSYIEDVTTRLNFYHRFSAAVSEEAIDNLVSELLDRFGDFPVEVKNLAELSRIRIIAGSMGVRSMNKFKNSLSVVFDKSANIDSTKVIPFLEKYRKQVKVTPDSKIVIHCDSVLDVFQFMREWLAKLQELFVNKK
ncbi:MAG: transcription-repair coupling factor [Deltaproteobacteria bacterium]|nr:transcription-repair coupling factor [Deltaproteobacteria bacterium]